MSTFRDMSGEAELRKDEPETSQGSLELYASDFEVFKVGDDLSYLSQRGRAHHPLLEALCDVFRKNRVE